MKKERILIILLATMLSFPVAANIQDRMVVSGDRLRMILEEQPELSKDYPVAGDGTIQIEEMGRVQVANLSLKNAALAIEEFLEGKYFKTATVTLSISEFVQGSVQVTGAVGRPITIPFKGDSIVTLFEAIIAAGGLKDRANASEVRILRWKAGGSLEREEITIDVQNMMENFDFEQDEFLRPRDIVYVPHMRGGDSQEVLLMGEVGEVGYHPYYEGLDVLRLIANTGGIAKTAKPDSARILRQNSGGDYNSIPVDLTVILGQADMSMNYKLKPGDILYVPAANYATGGQAFILGKWPVDGPVNLPLKGQIGAAKALLNAGFTDFSNAAKTKLKRVGPDGTKHIITINVEKILDTGDFEDDIPLLDGDILIIPEKIVNIPGL